MKITPRSSAVSILLLITLFLAPMVAMAPLTAQEQAQAPEGGAEAPDVEVETTRTETTTWYADPLWLTVGVIVLLLLILVIVLASRRGDRTTVIKS